jgi:hypothetical protein
MNPTTKIFTNIQCQWGATCHQKRFQVNTWLVLTSNYRNPRNWDILKQKLKNQAQNSNKKQQWNGKAKWSIQTLLHTRVWIKDAIQNKANQNKANQNQF